ncbi:MAG: histidine kinase [Defluviitaleaceae bacterium]|nr:histidine kinase [Defluviitaleaceae bacterium]
MLNDDPINFSLGKNSMRSLAIASKVIWLAFGVYNAVVFEPRVYIVLLLALFALSLSSLGQYISRKDFAVYSMFLYGMGCIIIPSGVFFMPLIMMGSTTRKHCLAGVVPVFAAMGQYYFYVAAFAILLSALHAMALGLVQELDENIRSLQDASVEEAHRARQTETLLREAQEKTHQIATLEERTRIARDIHDNVGHGLTRSILLLGAITAANKSPELETLQSTLKESMETIRRAVHNMKDEGVDLKRSLQRLAQDSGLEYRLDYQLPENLPGGIKFNFEAVTKEAIANTMRHSNATKIEITAQEHPAFYQLLIRDNGSNGGKGKPGRGLINITERTSEMGGSCNFDSHDGFKIFISVPKPPAGELPR